MNAVLDILKEPAFWALAIALATPLLFGIMGTQLCRSAGVFNFGAEGLFIAGAFAGHAVAQWGPAPWPGIAVAAATGLALGFFVGAVDGPRGPAQPLAGIALTLLVASVAAYAAHAGAGAPMPPFAPVQIPYLANLPHVGQVLFAQTPLAYLAVGCALVLAYLLARTPLGLAIRACGDNPLALTAQGRSAFGVRNFAVMLGSALIAVGGACLTLGAANPFTPGLVHGRGWLCLAIVLVIGPRMTLALVAALLFGAIDAVDERLVAHLHIPAELVALLPYVLVVIALAAIGRRGAPSPAAAA